MYSFDRSYYDRRLSAATTDEERGNALACRWEAIKLAVSHCDVVAGPEAVFSRSVGFWQRGYRSGDFPRLLVSDDCEADVTKQGMPLIHILGDLDATLTVSGHCEIVIGGSIRPGAGIIAEEGYVHAFIGGDLAGYVRNTGSSLIWIDGALRGEIETGQPSTHLHIMGDFGGAVRPIETGALLWVEVRGFMGSKSLETIAACKYTLFHASVGVSDQPQGIHPSEAYSQRGDGRARYLRWVVHAYEPSRTDA